MRDWAIIIGASFAIVVIVALQFAMFVGSLFGFGLLVKWMWG